MLAVAGNAVGLGNFLRFPSAWAMMGVTCAVIAFATIYFFAMVLKKGD